MNQPKFKFGDKVVTSNGKVFFVINISVCDDGYIYHHNGHGFEESSLEPYQEPQKKKRFAYVATNGELKDFMEEVDKSFHDDHGRPWHRAPEFDIEYPDKSHELATLKSEKTIIAGQGNGTKL